MPGAAPHPHDACERDHQAGFPKKFSPKANRDISLPHIVPDAIGGLELVSFDSPSTILPQQNGGDKNEEHASPLQRELHDDHGY